MIVIVGAGALGSHLVLLLRNRKENIVVVDYDRVEQKNVASQFHTRQGIGKNKTVALSRAMGGMFKRGISTKAVKLVPENLKEVLGEAMLVVDCTDNSHSRWLIRDYCLKNSIPCLHGALAADGSFGRVGWSDEFTIDEEDVYGQPTCEDGDHLPFIGLVSATLAHIVQTFLDDDHKSHKWVTGQGNIRSL